MKPPAPISPESSPRRWHPTSWQAWRIALIYATAGVLWIAGSGWLLHHSGLPPLWMDRLEFIKGWFFVLVTALLLGNVLSQAFQEMRQRAEQFRVSDERLRLLGDELPDSYVFQYEMTGMGQPKFTYVSGGVERLHGVKVADILRDANTLRNLVMPEGRPVLAAAELASARDLTDFQQEVWLTHPGGRRQLMYLRSHPTREADGVTRWNGIATDITARRRAEEALRESEEKFRQLVENLTDVFWMTSPDLHAIHYVSPGYAQIWGRSLASLYERPIQWAEAIFPEEREQVFAAFLSLKDGQPSVSVEYRITRPDGTVRWVHDRGFPVRNAAGEVIRLAGLASDITARKNAEEALQASQARLATALASMTEAVFISDTAGRFVEFNQAFVTYHRFRNRAECAQTFAEYPKFLEVFLASGELATVDQWAVPRALRGETGVNVEFALHRRDTGDRWVGSYNFAPIHNADGVIIGSVVSCRDITERKRAETALRQSEENFRAIFEMASVGMAQANPYTGQLVRVNRKFCEITGYSDAELLQRRVSDITHPEDRERDGELFQQVIRGEQPAYHLEKRYVRPDGSLAWVNVNMTVIRDAAGRPTRTLATIEDVTARKQLAEQFMQAQKMEAIGQLAGGVAHDFNNILGAILGNAELAAMDIPAGSVPAHCVNRITKATLRAKDLVKQILTYSRRQSLELKYVDLEAVVTDCVKLLRTSMPSSVKIIPTLTTGLPFILADSTQMHQVLYNLGTNAWHALHGQPGSITIGLTEASLDEARAAQLGAPGPGRYLCLTVSDTGAGMTEDIRQRIFEPFFTTKPTGQGTGLGLSVVLGIVKAHGGAIHVQSQPGHGTTFEIYLPAAEAKPALDVAPAARPVLRRQNLHVLFIDDQEPMVQLAQQLFQRLGCRVTACLRPAEALQAFQKNPDRFDIVFTDFDMPEISGLEVARQITRQQPRVPVVLLSGYVSEQVSQDAAKTGITATVAKPFGISEIAALLDKLFPADNIMVA